MSTFLVLRRGALAAAVAGLACTAIVLIASRATAHGAAAVSSFHVTVAGCARDIFGEQANAPATSVPGSESPVLVNDFSVLGRSATSADTITAEPGLRGTLESGSVSTFDPRGVRLLATVGDASAYLVPAVLRRHSVPAACTHLKQLAGIGAYVAVENETVGSGPGVCVVVAAPEQESGGPLGATGTSTSTSTSTSPTTTTTGAAATGPAEIAGSSCVSLAGLSTYTGLVGPTLVINGRSYLLVPDGVSSVTAHYASGAVKTITISDNLGELPDANSNAIGNPTATAIKAELERVLPTSVTETDPAGQPVTTLTRPAGFISLYLRDFAFEKKLLDGSGSTSTNQLSSQSSDGIPAMSASCGPKGACTSAFTSTKCRGSSKTCTTVTETTHCSAQHVCHSTVTTKQTARKKTSSSPSSSSSSYSSSGSTVLTETGRVR